MINRFTAARTLTHATAQPLPYAPVPRPSLYGPAGPAPAAASASAAAPPLPPAPHPHHPRQRVANDEAKARHAIYSNAFAEGVGAGCVQCVWCVCVTVFV